MENTQNPQDTQRTEDVEGPPESFRHEVKDALTHLLDLGRLQTHPLADRLGLSNGGRTEALGQRLRRALVGAIESLMPDRGLSFRSPHARRYHLLRLHYLQGRTVDDAAQEIGVSSRQAYRDLRQAEESVARILWADRQIQRADAQDLADTSVQAEMDRLGSQSRPTDLVTLIQHARDAVAQLARDRDIHVQIQTPQRPLIVTADPVPARQVLIGLLSQAIQQAKEGPLQVDLQSRGETVSVVFAYRIEPEDTTSYKVKTTTLQLVDRLGWAIREDADETMHVVTLRIRRPTSSILIIDDNQGLVKLLRRYLSDQACQVVHADNGREGLHAAQDMIPDAIILDVMMPEMDGWEFLQRLRNHPKTADVPVIICSVVNDPDLAYSLGASVVLEKPVSRRIILEAMAELDLI